jgi:hypothetical protein
LGFDEASCRAHLEIAPFDLGSGAGSGLVRPIVGTFVKVEKKSQSMETTRALVLTRRLGADRSET